MQDRILNCKYFHGLFLGCLLENRLRRQLHSKSSNWQNIWDIPLLAGVHLMFPFSYCRKTVFSCEQNVIKNWFWKRIAKALNLLLLKHTKKNHIICKATNTVLTSKFRCYFIFKHLLKSIIVRTCHSHSLKAWNIMEHLYFVTI